MSRRGTGSGFQQSSYDISHFPYTIYSDILTQYDSPEISRKSRLTAKSLNRDNDGQYAHGRTHAFKPARARVRGGVLLKVGGFSLKLYPGVSFVYPDVS